MKAKEYYKKILDSEDDIYKATTKVFVEIMQEFKDLKEKRFVSTDSGAIAILKELNQKATALIKLLNKEEKIITNDSFLVFLECAYPKIKRIYDNYCL